MAGKFTLSGFSDEIDEMIPVQFEHLSKLGIRYFEPRGINGKNISMLTDEEVLGLKDEMEKYGISVSSIGSPVGKILITDDFEPHMEVLKRTIRTAKMLGTAYIRMFSFYIPDGKYEEYRDEVMRRMKAMTALAESEGITLLHENEKGIYGDVASRCLEILETVDSPHLRAVFDPANFIQCGQPTYPEAFDLLRDYVVYMHIKDALSDGTVVPAGYGLGHVEDIIRTLSERGYQGFLSLEPHLGTFKGLEFLEIKSSIGEAKEQSTAETFDVAYRALMEILGKVE
ncbi:MAG: sugar phosphate isomerase/epimerase [Lachnospiraceae bacterium]|nr:sugar phosphate isomerase/epimerase [Lachnospiraceae bacterium]